MDVNPIEFKIGTSNYSETDNSVTDHPQPVSGRNVARKKTSLPPYNSYQSEVNAEPMDREIPSVRQFPATQNEKLLIPALDGDDEVCIWIENPVVVDLTSDDESSFKNDSRHEKMAHLETALSDMKNEIFVISDVDEDEPKYGPSKNSVDAVMHALSSSVEEKSCPALPELYKILMTPSMNTTATEGIQTESADFKCKVTTEPATSVIHSLQSLHQAPQMPELLCSTSTLLFDSPSLEYVSPQQNAVLPTCQSEPYDTGSRDNDHRSKKRKLSPERFNNARSDNTKGKLFNPMREKERDTRRRCNEAYEVFRQSHIRSSQPAVHSKYPILTSPHQRASATYGNAMDEYADSNSEIRRNSSRMQTKNYGDENGNGTNQMKEHSPRSENRQSSRSRIDDQFNSYESSQRSRIRSPTYRENMDNARYRGRYSDMDKRSISHTVTSRNEPMNGSDTSSAPQINKQFGSPINPGHSRKSQNNNWEPISLKKESCRLILSNGFDFLSEAYRTYRVQVRVDWTKRGSVLLWIIGTKADRRRFKTDLVTFEKLQTRNEDAELPASACSLVPSILNE